MLSVVDEIQAKGGSKHYNFVLYEFTCISQLWIRCVYFKHGLVFTTAVMTAGISASKIIMSAFFFLTSSVKVLLIHLFICFLLFFLENLQTKTEYHCMSTAGAEQVLFHCSPIQVKFRSFLNTSWKMKQSSAMPQTCTGGGRKKKRHSASSDQHSSRERKYNIVLRDAGIHLWTSLSAEPSLWAASQERKEKARAPGRNETPSAAHSSKKH